MLKGIPSKVIYMVTSIFKNKYGEIKKCLLWSIINQNSTSSSGSKYMLVWIVHISFVQIGQWLERAHDSHEIVGSNPTWANFQYGIEQP